jgi:hypothetical protein
MLLTNIDTLAKNNNLSISEVKSIIFDHFEKVKHSSSLSDNESLLRDLDALEARAIIHQRINDIAKVNQLLKFKAILNIA